MTKKILSIALIGILMFTLVACGGNGGDETGEPIYTPGKYTAETPGHNGNLSVEVEVDESKIVGITVVEHDETEGIGDGAITDLTKEIIEKQSTEVDAVTNATVTSNAFLKAVNEALNEAKK